MLRVLPGHHEAFEGLEILSPGEDTIFIADLINRIVVSQQIEEALDVVRMEVANIDVTIISLDDLISKRVEKHAREITGWSSYFKVKDELEKTLQLFDNVEQKIELYQLFAQVVTSFQHLHELNGLPFSLSVRAQEHIEATIIIIDRIEKRTQRLKGKRWKFVRGVKAIFRQKEPDLPGDSDPY